MIKPKILIVDDKVENLVALEQLLCDLDVDIVRALSGNEAIAKTLEFDFGIALLDVQMPDMDGFETLDLLRKNKQTENLPVIFISATYKEDYHKIEGIERGAVDFITKPLVPSVLLGKINIFLNIYNKRIQLSNMVGERDKALEELGNYRDILEELVQNRTKELEKINEELKIENMERKEAVEALQDSEERFRVALNNSSITVFNQDRDLRFTWVYNPGIDFDTEALIGKTDADIVGPEQAARPMEIKRRVLKTGKGIREELSTIFEGKTIYYNLNVEPIFDSNDEIAGIVGASIDTTERKQIENKLRESEKRLLKVQEIAKVGFLNFNFETNEIFLSDRVVDLYKLESGKNWVTPEFVAAIVHPDDLERAKKNLELLTEGKTPHNIDHRAIRTDGKIIWVHARHEIIYDNAGKPESLLGTIIDITERKHAEEELKKHREHLEELVKERTNEIKVKNVELERLNKLFVGREFRIKELKDKIKSFENKLIV
jgi:PAS domain S-box-containing protein